MIFNEHIDRLTEIEIVQEFMRRNLMQAKLCNRGDDYSLILYRLPYVVEFHDALIENYLEVTLADLDGNLLIGGSSALGCSLDLGLQNVQQLRARNFEDHPLNNIFLSFQSQKMRNLHSFLEAIDKLFPRIEAKGLSAMRDGTFDSQFDFTQSVSPMYYGLKEKYLQCLKEGG